MKFLQKYTEILETLNEELQSSATTSALNTSSAIEKTNLSKDPVHTTGIRQLRDGQKKAVSNTGSLLKQLNDHITRIATTMAKPATGTSALS